MKFGRRLLGERRAGWEEHYIDYDRLKRLLKVLHEGGLHEPGKRPCATPVSLSSGVPPGASGPAVDFGGEPVREVDFFAEVDAAEAGVRDFVQERIALLEGDLAALEGAVERHAAGGGEEAAGHLVDEARRISREFLALEKYTNLNVTALYKLLKKHDKLLPTNPCAGYRLARLHHQPWLEADHSSVFVVKLSGLHERLRGDSRRGSGAGAAAAAAAGAGAQAFVRSTRKFWVRVEDVSAVKQTLLEHLPVFLPEEGEFEGDSQLINSVYLDSWPGLELYHARLNKLPLSTALRLRWYGSGGPSTVFVERKTHRSSWAGEESVKERFALPEALVAAVLRGEHSAAEERARLESERPGAPAWELDAAERLCGEVAAVAEAKQVMPLVRTQYARCAFQVPGDATVRCSLDTSLCMLLEPDGERMRSLLHAEPPAWRRDEAASPLARTEVVRFPHAVLEIKTQLSEGDPLPAYISEMLDSGLLTEVRKFSKFMHGVAVLLPETVQAVPYWVDDVSLAASLRAVVAAPPGASEASASRAGSLGGEEARLSFWGAAKDRGAGEEGWELTHPLLGDRSPGERELDLVGDERVRAERLRGGDRRRGQRRCSCWPVPGWLARAVGCGRRARRTRKVPMRIEPKTYFANERTYLSWLSMAVNIGLVGAALGGISVGKGGAVSGGFNRHTAVVSLVLLPSSVLFCSYALWTFVWRGRRIRARDDAHYHDDVGPVFLGGVIIAMLSTILGLSAANVAARWHDVDHDP